MSLLAIIASSVTTPPPTGWTLPSGWTETDGVVQTTGTGTRVVATTGAELGQATISGTVTLTDRAGIVARYVDANNYLSVELDVVADSINLNRITNGVRRVLIESRAEALTAGQTYAVRLDLDGPHLTLFTPSGARVASITETQGQGADVYGVIQVSATPATFDVQAGALAGPSINWPIFSNRHASPDIALGVPGSWEDTDINNPNVVWDPVGARWVMYYTGYSENKPSGDDGVQMAGIAYASTLDGPWTKEPANPVISSLDTGQWSHNGGMERLDDGTWVMAVGTNGGMITRFYKATSPAGPWTVFGPTLDNSGDAYLRINQTTRALEHWSYFPISGGRVGRRRTSTDGGLTWSAPETVVPMPPMWGKNNGEITVFVAPGKEGQEMWASADFFPDLTLAAGRGEVVGFSPDYGTTWFWHVVLTKHGSLGWDNVAAFDSALIYDEPRKRLYMYYAGVTSSKASADTGLLNMGIQIGHAWADWDHTQATITYP